eukprot:UN00963
MRKDFNQYEGTLLVEEVTKENQ